MEFFHSPRSHASLRWEHNKSYMKASAECVRSLSVWNFFDELVDWKCKFRTANGIETKVISVLLVYESVEWRSTWKFENKMKIKWRNACIRFSIQKMIQFLNEEHKLFSWTKWCGSRFFDWCYHVTARTKCAKNTNEKCSNQKWIYVSAKLVTGKRRTFFLILISKDFKCKVHIFSIFPSLSIFSST